MDAPMSWRTETGSECSLYMQPMANGELQFDLRVAARVAHVNLTRLAATELRDKLAAWLASTPAPPAGEG